MFLFVFDNSSSVFFCRWFWIQTFSLWQRRFDSARSRVLLFNFKFNHQPGHHWTKKKKLASNLGDRNWSKFEIVLHNRLLSQSNREKERKTIPANVYSTISSFVRMETNWWSRLCPRTKRKIIMATHALESFEYINRSHSFAIHKSCSTFHAWLFFLVPIDLTPFDLHSSRWLKSRE